MDAITVLQCFRIFLSWVGRARAKEGRQQQVNKEEDEANVGAKRSYAEVGAHGPA